MANKELKHDATKRAMVAAFIRADDILRANESDHDLAVLIRKLREKKNG